MHLEQTHSVGMDAHIGDERAGQTARDNTYRAFDRLIRAYEARRAPAFERQLLDQRNVEIRTDAEGEQPARSALLCYACRNRGRIAHTYRRLTIRQEQNDW